VLASIFYSAVMRQAGFGRRQQSIATSRLVSFSQRQA